MRYKLKWPWSPSQEQMSSAGSTAGPKASAKRRWIKWLLVGAALVAFVLLIFPFGLVAVSISFRSGLARLHLNPYLTTVISLVYCSLGAAAVRYAFSVHKQRRRMGGILVMAWVIAGLLGNALILEQVNFSPSGKPLKYYSNTPAFGYREFTGPGFDPIAGVQLQPVTPESVATTAYAQKPFLQLDPRKVMAFFDRQTGQPLVFFCRRDNECLVFFNGPGFDPRTGQALAPVSSEIVAECQEQIESRTDCLAALDQMFGTDENHGFTGLAGLAQEIKKFQ